MLRSSVNKLKGTAFVREVNFITVQVGGIIIDFDDSTDFLIFTAAQEQGTQ